MDGEPGAQDAVRVVVADDADGVRDLVCLLLDMEPDFVVVGQARDGAEAIEIVSCTEPDLVLLDVAMPVMDGLTALPAVRRVAPRARVVIFTGFSEQALGEQASALGAHALIEKGLAVDSLVDRLREVCGRAPAPVAVSRSTRR
ncbi:response regulator receiver protein [Candidatus Protofrankia californiensis]|uniref:Response regulator receiver protein n=1 Tax=Candidatus Protofrankia californiensis TaxID=1839754 RepID=A0A1C3PFT9_9ACTN|nr:response regulator receiver protein [Candidatus Protofrankia californiensis]